MIFRAVRHIMFATQKSVENDKSVRIVDWRNKPRFVKLTVVLGHSHRAVDVRCQSLWGNMVIDLVENRYLNPNMDRRVVLAVPICGDTFDSMDLDR